MNFYYIQIIYNDGREENLHFSSFDDALKKQRELLKKKKFKESVRVCKIKLGGL